jgi:hypothetical protein
MIGDTLVTRRLALELRPWIAASNQRFWDG